MVSLGVAFTTLSCSVGEDSEHPRLGEKGGPSVFFSRSFPRDVDLRATAYGARSVLGTLVYAREIVSLEEGNPKLRSNTAVKHNIG